MPASSQDGNRMTLAVLGKGPVRQRARAGGPGSGWHWGAEWGAHPDMAADVGQAPLVAAADRPPSACPRVQRKDENALLINTDYVQRGDISAQPSTLGPPGPGEPEPSGSQPLPSGTARQQGPSHADCPRHIWSRTSCSKHGTCPRPQPRGATAVSQPQCRASWGVTQAGGSLGERSRGCPGSGRTGMQHRASPEVPLPPSPLPSPRNQWGVAQFLGGRGWLTITCTTKSFWILVSCSRMRSVSSLPEKNQRCQARSMPSCTCSCFFSCPMVSPMLALSRRSLPVESRTLRVNSRRALGRGSAGSAASSSLRSRIRLTGGARQ